MWPENTEAKTETKQLLQARDQKLRDRDQCSQMRVEVNI